MPSPLPLQRFLPRDFSPSLDLRPCSSPLEISSKGSRLCSPGGTPAPKSRRLPPRLAWCAIDWEQVRLLEPLGAGGFGSVYRATYRGETVALKKVKRSDRNRLACRQSFWGELNVAHLRHGHLVRLLAAAASAPEDRESLGTVIMEYAGGSSLHRALYGERAPSPPRCLRYARQVASGLRFLHAAGIVHLDLKPANLLLAEGDVCKIGDFGCSRRLQDLRSPAAAAAHPCQLGGTYTHRAPELLRGERVTAKADVYSFAITLWQMLSRELPYSGERQCVLYAVVAYELRPAFTPAFRRAAGGSPLPELIRDCWQADPERRPSAAALLQRLSSPELRL